MRAVNAESTPSGPSPSLLLMNPDFRRLALALAPQAAAVANYCDHVEHNEAAKPAWVIDAAEELRLLALEFATEAQVDLVELYAERLGAIEAHHPLMRPGGFDGHAAALAAGTWRELQLVQAEHDRCYHADVVGLAKAEQLRHYALHLTKVVGAFAEPRSAAELLTRRLPDTLLFALKLRTVMSRRLPDESLPIGGRVNATPARV
jgi:hypothetical protein